LKAPGPLPVLGFVDDPRMQRMRVRVPVLGGYDCSSRWLSRRRRHGVISARIIGVDRLRQLGSLCADRPAAALHVG
jgi:hypothetical protein